MKTWRVITESETFRLEADSIELTPRGVTGRDARGVALWHFGDDRLSAVIQEAAR
jgi:hypothetical protein